MVAFMFSDNLASAVGKVRKKKAACVDQGLII